jgi:ribosome recycling factor
MNTSQAVLHDAEERMKKSLEVFQKNLGALRSGRANSGMVEHLRVDYYGVPTPLKQVANITVPEPRMILIQPWDTQALKPIEKALGESDLGIAPVIDGKLIRLVIPALTRERREELVKVSSKNAEEARVSHRAIRREANEKVKQLEKDKEITEDDSRKSQESVQKLTDKYIQLVDQAHSQKEKELIQN